MTWFWMNIPAAALFFGLWAGIPLRMVLRRRQAGPEAAAASTATAVHARRSELAEAAYRRVRYPALVSATAQR